MKITEVKCKTALSKSNLPGLDYSLNCYRGCQHSCAYCYVPNVLRIEREEWGSFVDVKTNIPVVLSKELIKKKPGVVGISTVTDPYQPVEKKYKLTRYCLEQLIRYDFPICIQTKSDLIIRDIDIISRFSNIEVLISIGTINDDERKILEPHASTIDQRLKILKEFSEVGVKTSVFFGPIYPTLTSKNIEALFDVCEKYNVSEVMIDEFNLKPGIKENLSSYLKNSKYFDIYEKNLFQEPNYYSNLKKLVKKIGADKNIKIRDAF